MTPLKYEDYTGTKDGDCVVCQESLKEGKVKAHFPTGTVSGHLIHKKCLLFCLKTQNTSADPVCPLCKKVVDLNSVNEPWEALIDDLFTGALTGVSVYGAQKIYQSVFMRVEKSPLRVYGAMSLTNLLAVMLFEQNFGQQYRSLEEMSAALGAFANGTGGWPAVANLCGNLGARCAHYGGNLHTLKKMLLYTLLGAFSVSNYNAFLRIAAAAVTIDKTERLFRSQKFDSVFLSVMGAILAMNGESQERSHLIKIAAKSAIGGSAGKVAQRALRYLSGSLLK